MRAQIDAAERLAARARRRRVVMGERRAGAALHAVGASILVLIGAQLAWRMVQPTVSRYASHWALVREEGLGCAGLLAGIDMDAPTAEDCGRAHLEPLPPRALLVLTEPWELRAARYAQRCIHPPVRPDVAVLNAAVLADESVLAAVSTLPPYAGLTLSAMPAPPLPTSMPLPAHASLRDLANEMLVDARRDTTGTIWRQAVQQLADDNGPLRPGTALTDAVSDIPSMTASWPHPAVDNSGGNRDLTGRPLFVGGHAAERARLDQLHMSGPFGVTWIVAPSLLTFYDSPALRARVREAASAAVAAAVLQHGFPSPGMPLRSGDGSTGGGVGPHAGFAEAQVSAAKWLAMGAADGDPWPWRPSSKRWADGANVGDPPDARSLLTAAAVGEAVFARVDAAAGRRSHAPDLTDDAVRANAAKLSLMLRNLALVYDELADLPMPHTGGDPLPTDVPWPQPGGSGQRLVRVGDSASLAAAAARRPAQLRARQAELEAIAGYIEPA
jgi:hypothetical protein